MTLIDFAYVLFPIFAGFVGYFGKEYFDKKNRKFVIFTNYFIPILEELFEATKNNPHNDEAFNNAIRKIGIFFALHMDNKVQEQFYKTHYKVSQNPIGAGGYYILAHAILIVRQRLDPDNKNLKIRSIIGTLLPANIDTVIKDFNNAVENKK